MLHIDIDVCTGCGLCEQNCAFDAIHVVDGLAEVNENCALCGVCVDVCETGALYIEGQDSQEKSGDDLAKWTGVWVFGEYRNGRAAPVTFELLGVGRRLADARGSSLSVVVFADDIGDLPQQLISYGADNVYVVEDPVFSQFNDDVYANILEDLARNHKPEIILAGATAIGRSFIPRVATSLCTGLTADCTQLEIQEEDGACCKAGPPLAAILWQLSCLPKQGPRWQRSGLWS